MDPPFPPLNPSFTPLPHPNPKPNPNPNPNPNHIPPTADLPTTISLLKDLAALAESTLHSASALLSSPNAAGFGRCPFDPWHRMPPESLFRHSLLCPSAPGAPLLDPGLLDNLRYPTSLKSESQLQRESRLVRPLAGSDADLCFSLDCEFAHLASNFFYRDCPGVVTTPEPDASARTFTLPAVLSAECTNFVSDGKYQVSGEGRTRILPSEFWALRCEVGAWRDYPASYSYTVLRVASCLPGPGEGCLKKWVVSNSPRYGVLIDGAMRDHIFLLLKLCLKAIGREACCSLELLSGKDDGLFDPRSLNIECPRLVESLTWLVSHLSVLYGDVNGKFFAIGVLKESLLHTGSNSSLIRLGRDKVGEDSCGSRAGVQDPLEGSCNGQVFVSQVAAAVAALHERLLLEERINMLRLAQPPSKYQLLSEYSYASTRGSEERGKRPNYNAVLEHDGLYWQRGQNQDQGKTKTREELLAEERDYKRRRMSYRGKKVKRTPTQVVRDIIEEHMDQIKQAGGIGCNLKVAADTVVLPLECNSQSEIPAGIRELQSSSYNTSERRGDSSVYKEPLHAELQSSSYNTSERRGDSSVYKKPLHAEYTLTSRKHGNVSRSDRSSKSHDSRNSHEKLRYEHSEHWEDCKRSKHESGKNYGSRSPPSHRSYAQSRERYAHQNEQGDVEQHKSKYDRTDSWSKDNNRSTLTSMSTKEEYDFLSDTRNKDTGRSSDSRRSGSVMQNVFENRYDPSGSYDGYGSTYDDASVGSNYFRPGKIPTTDTKYHDEQQRHDHTAQKRHRNHPKN